MMRMLLGGRVVRAGAACVLGGGRSSVVGVGPSVGAGPVLGGVAASASASLGGARRSFAEEAGASSVGMDAEAFAKAWKKVAPNLDVPTFQHELLQRQAPEVPAGGGLPLAVSLNFYLPNSVIAASRMVYRVDVPATTGVFGVLPGRVPTVAQLRPGVLGILAEEGSAPEQYFVAAGFAFVHPNSICDVVAVEAVPVADLDPDAVREGMAKFVQQLAQAASDEERAQAQIGVEVHKAMSDALGLGL